MKRNLFELSASMLLRLNNEAPQKFRIVSAILAAPLHY